MSYDNKIKIRSITLEYCTSISSAFEAQGWTKPIKQFEEYFADQVNGERDILIAECHGEFAGYLTIKWQSYYEPFRNKSIPEIMDLNVLIKFQRKGIATALMNEAERRVGQRSDTIGIAVGLTGDYGNAQRLYIKRGYIPDGLGISQNEKLLRNGDIITVDDDLVFCLTKSLLSP